MSQRRTIEQDRAAEAWKDIEEIEDTAKKADKAGAKKLLDRYGTLARRLPALIQINGLGSTMAFLLSKAKSKKTSADYLIYHHISERVIGYLSTNEQKPYADLMTLIRDAKTQDEYRRATAEAIQYGIWLKRYAEAQDWGSEQGDDNS